MANAKPPIQIDWIDADKHAQPKGYIGEKQRFNEAEERWGMLYIQLRRDQHETRLEEYRLREAFLLVQGDLFENLAQKDQHAAERARLASLRKQDDTAAMWKIAVYATEHKELLQEAERSLSAAGEQNLAGKLQTWRLNARAIDKESNALLIWQLLGNPDVDIKSDAAKTKWLDQHARHYERTGEDPIKLLKFHAGQPLNKKKPGWEEHEKDQRALKDLIDVFQPFTKGRLKLLNDVQSALERHGASVAKDFGAFTEQVIDILPKRGRLGAPPPAPSSP